MTDMSKVISWMTGSDTGMSSKAIAAHMTTGECDGSFPCDPADLGRCLRLLDLFPEWERRMPEMGKYNSTWKRIAGAWPELRNLMTEEVGVDWSKGKRAERTYSAMKDLRY